MASGGTTPKLVPQISFLVFKEPRGLIRLLHFVFSIFAFATTSGFSTDIKFLLDGCNNNETVTFILGYPFNLEDIHIDACPKFSLLGDFSSQAKFFVTIGVLAFLYCIASLVVYFLFEQLYQENITVPVADFGATLVFAVLWLISSSLWAQGVADLKYFSDPNNFLQGRHECGTGLCKSVYSGSFATLNVSLLFGFLNFSLWTASLWFIYKETAWFKRRQENAGT